MLRAAVLAIAASLLTGCGAGRPPEVGLGPQPGLNRRRKTEAPLYISG
jgi:hypothetical protein